MPKTRKSKPLASKQTHKKRMNGSNWSKKKLRPPPSGRGFRANYGKFEFDGKSYLEDCKTGNIHHLTTKKHIGRWNWKCDDIEWIMEEDEERIVPDRWDE
jgi:hypothetical protein